MTLPEEEPETSDFAIRLLVSGTPEHIKGDPVDRAIWLNLPMASDILANYAAAFNEADIGDCVYYDFESVIPQITSDMFGSMSDVQTLNKLAAEISIMSEAEQVKFKAVLEAENTASIQDALNVAQSLWRYKFTAMPDTADAFSKIMLPRMQILALTAGGLAVCLRETMVNACSAASVQRLPITALFPHETDIYSSPCRMTSRRSKNRGTGDDRGKAGCHRSA